MTEFSLDLWVYFSTVQLQTVVRTDTTIQLGCTIAPYSVLQGSIASVHAEIRRAVIFVFIFFNICSGKKVLFSLQKSTVKGMGETLAHGQVDSCVGTAMGCRLSVSPTFLLPVDGTGKQQLLSHLWLRLQAQPREAQMWPLLEQIFKLLLTSHSQVTQPWPDSWV